MMGTALHPYHRDLDGYTATPDLASGLDSDGFFDGDDTRGTSNKHIAEVKIMIGKIDRFKVRTVSRIETSISI
jgi:hypothetical protein